MKKFKIVHTDPPVIAVKEYARKTVKVIALATVVYVMSYGAGKAIGTHAMTQK